MDEIAEELIGDEELTEHQNDTDSVVGKAEKRAQRQNRDLAIDTQFQNKKSDDT